MSPTELPTPFADLNTVLDELVASQRAVLGGSFVGTYLQGSLAVGGFDQYSDVDWIVAVQQELSDTQVDALQAMHGRIYDLESEWAKHLEGSYFPVDVLRDHARSGRDLWYLDHGARSLERSDHCNTVVVRWTVREHGIALAGPEPAALIDGITTRVLRRDIYGTINVWGRQLLADPEPYRNRFYQGFIVLSYCRMLHELFLADTRSKRAGAEWAKLRLDPAWADLIDAAWDTRPDPARQVRTRPDPDAWQRTLEFVAYVMEESEQVWSHLQPGDT
jgi:hypothetical protein